MEGKVTKLFPQYLHNDGSGRGVDLYVRENNSSEN
jgi:hypothetical protein